LCEPVTLAATSENEFERREFPLKMRLPQGYDLWPIDKKRQGGFAMSDYAMTRVPSRGRAIVAEHPPAAGRLWPCAARVEQPVEAR
jgi:hypothetical protein